MSKASPRYKRTNPALPVIGTNHVYQVSVQGTVDGMVWIVNLAYMGPNTVSTNTESNIATTFNTTCSTAIRGVMDSTALFTTIKVSSLDQPSRIPYVAAVNGGAGYAGSVGATHIPIEMAAIISKYTNIKGQHGRGRNYWPAVPASFVTPGTDPNRLNATGIAAYQTLITAIDNAAITDGATVMDLCIYTRPLKGQPVTNAQATITYIMRPLLGTVRRRRPGRGK